jgi:hypothetical protein
MLGGQIRTWRWRCPRGRGVWVCLLVLCRCDKEINSPKQKRDIDHISDGSEKEKIPVFLSRLPFFCTQCSCDGAIEATHVQIPRTFLRHTLGKSLSFDLTQRRKRGGPIGSATLHTLAPSEVDHSHFKVSTLGGCRDVESDHPPALHHTWLASLVAARPSHVNALMNGRGVSTVGSTLDPVNA